MSEELTTIKGGALANVPDHLKDVHGREGLENVRKEDLVLPRLIICQSTHPQRKKTNSLFIEGLEDGELFNDVSGQNFGYSTLFIPLLFAASRIYFRKLEEGGGILCRSANGIDGGTIAPKCSDCPNSKFGADKPPLCTEFLNFPGILVGASNQLAVASFKSKGLKPARRFITRMQMMNKPSFAGVYEVRSNPEKNAKGEFFVPSFTLKRWTTAEEYQFAQTQYNSLKGRTIVVDDIPEEEHEGNIPF